MRYIPINTLLSEIFATEDGKKIKRSLTKAHKTVAKKAPDKRQEYIDANGSAKWSPVKEQLVAILGNKCWYTEAELVGAPLTIDHYRPKCDYWYLAFDAENYRISCPYANSPKHNKENGCTGGKGNCFPLMGLGIRARRKKELKIEKPLILDPCNQEDCNLVTFQADGRPAINPKHENDIVAIERVKRSTPLLNLDLPDFNSKRESLFHDISTDVKMYEELPHCQELRNEIRKKTANRLAANAPFSMAARQYLRFYRYLDWIQEVLNESC